MVSAVLSLKMSKPNAWKKNVLPNNTPKCTEFKNILIPKLNKLRPILFFFSFRSTPKNIQYTDFHKSKTSNSIWKHFLRATDGQSLKCKTCDKIIKTGGGSTTALHTHFRSVHSNIASTSTDSTPSTSRAADTPGILEEKQLVMETKKRKLMTDFFKSSDSMEVVVSRMAALVGCTFRLFTESQDLRHLFKKSGLELQKSPNTIAKIVLNQTDELKAEIKNKISVLKQAGHRYSITLDEWTSLRNKRYMNVNLHSIAFGGFNYKNLGIVKITGSMSALNALEILRAHLAKFNVSLDEDIVSVTTDGASVMVKMGRYIKGHHQICLAHGIQLAVISV